MSYKIYYTEIIMLKEEIKFSDSDIFEGMPSVSAILKAYQNKDYDRRIIKILFDESKLSSKRREYNFLKAKSKQFNFRIETVDIDTINKLSVGNTHGGVLAFCTERNIPELTPDSVKESGIYYILEGIEDPYNFGYSIRSIYASGADGIILDHRNWMGAAGVVARSSAGASELIDMHLCDAVDAIKIFKNKSYTTVCAGIRNSVSLFDAELKKPLLVIIGGEKRGISRSVLDLADKIVRIDYGTEFNGSLSAAAAASIISFDVMRKNIDKIRN